MTSIRLIRLAEDTVAKQFPRLTERVRADFAEMPTEDEMARYRESMARELAFADEAEAVLGQLSKLAMGSGTKQYLVAALSTEHRTILAQIAAAVAQAVMATTYASTGSALHFDHVDHDGRLTCDTVRGAQLMQHQPVI